MFQDVTLKKEVLGVLYCESGNTEDENNLDSREKIVKLDIS